MKLNNLAAVALMVAASVGTQSQAVPGSDYAVDPDFFPRKHRGKGQNNRRGTGKCKPPRSRPNRLIISKRVRRKHRRQA